MAVNFGLLVLAVLSALQLSLAAQFAVGGSGLWNLGNAYQSWADGNTYQVGDSLVFSYSGATHSVVETDSTGFQSCTPSNAILQDSSGNTVVPLQTAGTHYFICGSPGHCAAGMKFSVSVLPSSATMPASGSGTVTPPSATGSSSGTVTPASGTCTTTTTPITEESSAVPPPSRMLISAGMTVVAAFVVILS